MIVAAVGFALQAERVARERDRAEREAARANSIASFLQNTLSSADPWTGGSRSVTVTDALASAVSKLDQSFQQQPLDGAAVRRTIASTYAGLGLFDDGERLVRSALEVHRAGLGSTPEDVAETLMVLAEVQKGKGQDEQAEASAREALSIRQSLNGTDHSTVADSLDSLATILQRRGQFKEAQARGEEALAILRRVLGPRDEKVADSLQILGVIASNQSADYDASRHTHARRARHPPIARKWR